MTHVFVVLQNFDKFTNVSSKWEHLHRGEGGGGGGAQRAILILLSQTYFLAAICMYKVEGQGLYNYGVKRAKSKGLLTRCFGTTKINRKLCFVSSKC